MDVNGTRYHLLYGLPDWRGCSLVEEGRALPLADLLTDMPGQNPHAPLEWDADSGGLRLAGRVPLFRPRSPAPRLDITARRGAGRDRYGNWYWIDPGEGGIRFLANDARQSTPYWSGADLAARCVPVDAFETRQPPAPPPRRLRGLAVTTRHYLVVGDVTERGLLIFDLHGGGAPLLLRWPEDTPFEPWDLAATPDGGVLVLDRANQTYWALDARFRLLAEVGDEEPTLFQPVDATAPRHATAGAVQPLGYPLVTGSPPEPLSPVSIEPGPDGTVLVLDTDIDDGGRRYSIIHQYRGAAHLAAFSLEDAVEATDPRGGEGATVSFPVAGHDFAYVEEAAEPDAPTPVLYVAERGGDQVLAFVLDRAGGPPADRRDFLPLRRWGGKGLVAAGGAVYYDFADRWVPLQVYTECHYAGRATFTTPTSFAPDLPGGPFDGRDPGCVWHRLLLDAQLPPGTAARVRARAADDPDRLAQAGWIAQPDPYRRSGGAEIPYYDPWADLRAGAEPVPDGTGTWELLFQGVEGRYLELEVTLEGTGRATPVLRALRAWYPRYSYPEHYLPAIYRAAPAAPGIEATRSAAASFLERWLANPEGFYTELEGKIEHAAALLDPRTTPPEALDWLACWFGVVLDPGWDERRRRFFIRNADRLYRRRGTVGGIEAALRVYLDDVLDASIFAPACPGGSRVRIVEQFLTRGAGGLAYGDPTVTGQRELRTLTPADVAATAHRFTALVPHDLPPDRQAMVERILRLEKPAHTAVDLKRYWDFFRVGEARLGIDTLLGDGNDFEPLLLGETHLPDGYLAAPYPFDVDDRVVADRDRLGDLPPL